jgi:hypothetical protein
MQMFWEAHEAVMKRVNETKRLGRASLASPIEQWSGVDFSRIERIGGGATARFMKHKLFNGSLIHSLFFNLLLVLECSLLSALFNDLLIQN